MKQNETSVAPATASLAIADSHAPASPPPSIRRSRDDIAKAVISALCEDFLAHGAEAIEEVRTTRPVDYLKILLSVLPKETEKASSAPDAIGDDEFDTLVAAARSALAILAGEDDEGSDGGQSPETLPALP